MLTIKTLEKIKIGSRTTLFNGIYAVLLGIFYLAFYEFIIKNNFRKIDIVWQVFEKYNPEISKLIIQLLIIKALFIIAFGLVIIYLSVYILKKKDKTAWLALLILGMIFWVSILVFEILDKNFYTITLIAIGWISFIVGMLIPIRYYTEREYDEDY
jgi:hypothetical protein